MKKIYVLLLSHMRGNIDNPQPVAIFDNLEKLKRYYNNQLSEKDWTDNEESLDFFGHSHSYQKVFKKGSKLEWYNPAEFLEPTSSSDIYFGGVCEQSLNTDKELSQDLFSYPFNPNS